MHISTPHHFHLGPGFWGLIPEESRHSILRRYAARAEELLACHQVSLPDKDRLRLIVQTAMEARALLFVAALDEPTTEDLDEFFDDFVIHSVSGIPAFTKVTRYED